MQINWALLADSANATADGKLNLLGVYPQLVASVGRHNKLAPGYVEDAVLIIEELLTLQQQ